MPLLDYVLNCQEQTTKVLTGAIELTLLALSLNLQEHFH